MPSWALSLLLLAGATGFEETLREGLLALSRNDLTAAAAKLEAAQKLKPGDARVWLALAQTRWKSGDKKSAAESAVQAEKIAPEDPLILHGLAMFYTEAGDLAKAADLESRYAAKATNDPAAHARAAQLQLSAGNAGKAIEHATIAIKTDDSHHLHNLLGKAYERSGAHDKAVLELQEALKRNPYEESYYFDLADVLLRHQNFEAAIRVLEASREVFAKSPQLELALGVAYYGQRRFSDAVDSFLKTIAMAPDVEQPYVFLGRILEHAGDRVPQITQAFAGFASRNPRNAAAQHLHAKALIASGGDPARAESLLRRAIELQPSYWEAHYDLGLLLEKTGKLPEAAASLERGIALNPEAPAPHYRLARIYDRLGKREAAAEQRALHQKLSEEEKAALEKHAAGVKRLELVIK